MTSGKTPTWKTLDVPTYSYLIPSFGWAKWTAGRPSLHLSYRETMGVVWVESSRERKSRGKRTVPRSISDVFWNWRGRSKKVGTTFKRWQCWKSKRKNCPSQTFRAPRSGCYCSSVTWEDYTPCVLPKTQSSLPWSWDSSQVFWALSMTHLCGIGDRTGLSRSSLSVSICISNLQ